MLFASDRRGRASLRYCAVEAAKGFRVISRLQVLASNLRA